MSGLWTRLRHKRGRSVSDQPTRGNGSVFEAEPGLRRRASPLDSPRHSIPAQPADSHPDCFANAMRMTIRIGQMFSLLPVDTRSGRRSCWRAVYAGLMCVSLATITGLSLANESRQPSILGFVMPVFYGMNALMGLLYIRLAGQWANVLRAFRQQDRKHGPIRKLRFKLNTIAIVLLSMATVEHGLSELSVIMSLNSFHNVSTIPDFLEVYNALHFPMVRNTVGFWPPLSPFLFFVKLTATCIWNFNDLFIILVSVAIAERFRVLKDSLENAVGDVLQVKDCDMEQSVMGTTFWRNSRQSYNSLSGVTRVVDSALNAHLFVSFVNNLYFICMQLLKGFDSSHKAWYENLYIVFSFSFLVGRTAAVSIFAASVRERSRSIKDTLYCVSSEDYGQEVYRFLVQVTSGDVALTGCNMFSVTRPLLLTVAGTILTYEVVLVQLK